MSQSDSKMPVIPYRLFKECLAQEGMVWKSNRDHMLSNRLDGRRVAQALRRLEVPLQHQHVQEAMCAIMRKAASLARHGRAAEVDDTYKFVMVSIQAPVPIFSS